MNLRRLVPAPLHTTDRPSSTAQWTTLGRALELGRRNRIVTDAFAPVFLSRYSQALWRGLRTAGPVVRQAERLELLGLAASGLSRHRCIDEHLLAALPDVEQVLILGAGYDSRAYRFATEIGARPVFEIDLAPLSRRKAAIVAAHQDVFGHASVHRVEIDFRTQTLRDQLAGSGFVPGTPAFVAWEGVSPYLDRAAVEETLEALAGICGAGSVLAMDFWHHVDGAGGYRFRVAATQAMRLIGEPITLAVDPRDACALLAAHRFASFDVADGTELTSRYATDGRRCDPGMFVVAARLS